MIIQCVFLFWIVKVWLHNVVSCVIIDVVFVHLVCESSSTPCRRTRSNFSAIVTTCSSLFRQLPSVSLSFVVSLHPGNSCPLLLKCYPVSGISLMVRYLSAWFYVISFLVWYYSFDEILLILHNLCKSFIHGVFINCENLTRIFKVNGPFKWFFGVRDLYGLLFS